MLLRAQNITKRFPGVVALKDVSFDLREGEIHALCGENGAGKSTLIKLLSGIHPHGSYEGRFEVNGVEARFETIKDAEKAGLAVIYQELALVEEMTVAENIFLGREPRRWGAFIDWPRMHREAQALLDRFKVDLDPAAPVRTLGVGQKQLVEIVKALAKDSKILILDEPTAALAEHEVLILLDILRDLRKRGIASIYISHKLDEVFNIADRITVLRDGTTVCTQQAADTSKNEVIRHMVGREIGDLFPRRTSQPGEVILRVDSLAVADAESGTAKLHDISFELRAGEVLGIGG
jgi:D-xylose transport system ATP-binding protein